MDFLQLHRKKRSKKENKQQKITTLYLPSVTFLPLFNDCVALTVCDKVLRHMQGNLDSERAGVLRGVDNGNDTCADGDQRQGDLIQRAVWVAWR